MFDAKLESTVKDIQGAQAAILMGFDGIPVASFIAEKETDIETVGMELSVVLKEVRKAAELLEAGDATELMVKADKLTAVLRIINDEYFVALALTPEGNIGKSRYLLRILAPEFKEEL